MAKLSDPDVLLGRLKALAERDTPVSMTTTYKGILLSQPVKIIKVHPTSVIFGAPTREICSILRDRVYLHSQFFPEVIQANLVDLNATAGRMILARFSSTESSWIDRRAERVQPETPTVISLHWMEKVFRAEMLNISANGIGALAYQFDSTENRLALDSEVKAEFVLPITGEKLTVDGRVVNMSRFRHPLMKLGIKTYPNTLQSRKLMSYTEKRRGDIVAELNNLSVHVMETGQSASMFF